MKACISCWANKFENDVCLYCWTKNTQNENIRHTIYYIEKDSNKPILLHIIVFILIWIFMFNLVYLISDFSILRRTNILIWDKFIIFLFFIKIILYANLFYTYFSKSTKFVSYLIYFFFFTLSINITSAIITSWDSSEYIWYTILSLPLMIITLTYIWNNLKIIENHFSKITNNRSIYYTSSVLLIIYFLNLWRGYFLWSDTEYKNNASNTEINNTDINYNQTNIIPPSTSNNLANNSTQLYSSSNTIAPATPTITPTNEVKSLSYIGNSFSPSNYESLNKNKIIEIWDKYLEDLWEIDYSKYDLIYKEVKTKFEYSKTLQQYILDKLEHWKNIYDQKVIAYEYMKILWGHDIYNIQEYQDEIEKVNELFWDKPATANTIIKELNKIHLGK
jgi:hypothetical protein